MAYGLQKSYTCWSFSTIWSVVSHFSDVMERIHSWQIYLHKKLEICTFNYFWLDFRLIILNRKLCGIFKTLFLAAWFDFINPLQLTSRSIMIILTTAPLFKFLKQIFLINGGRPLNPTTHHNYQKHIDI